jgi:hypothetical protein
MSEQITPFYDNTFNLDEASNYTLLLLVDANSFSYAVTFNNKLLACNFNCDVNELINPKQLHQILSASYKNVIIGLNGKGFVLVPQPFYNADRIVDFARPLDVSENEKVLAQLLDEKNYVIYKVAEQQLAAIEKFNSKHIVFAAKGLIKAVAQNTPLNFNLYLNITDHKVEFVYFKQDVLRFYNSFEAKSADDVAYFSALVTQELEMQPQYTNLILSGNVQTGDVTFIRLSSFFAEVIISNIALLELPAEIQPHHILSLASLSLCGSSEVR